MDINESGSSVLSTKLTIDNTEKHRQPQQQDQLLVMVTWLMMLKLRLILTKLAFGDGTAKGLKVTLNRNEGLNNIICQIG